MMTDIEYKQKKAALIEKHQKELEELSKEYAFANAKAKIGDWVTDHFHSIRVEKMSYTMGYIDEMPQAVYIGTTCKKDGTESKRFDPNDKSYNSNIIAVNGKPVKK
jgi:hypothetical protein